MDYIVCRATGILKLQNLNLLTFDTYNLLAFFNYSVMRSQLTKFQIPYSELIDPMDYHLGANW